MLGGGLEQARAETGRGVGLDKARRDHVHLDPVRAKLLCQHARRAVKGGFCRALRKKALAGGAGQGAAYEDYLPGLPLHHVLQCGLHREENGLHLAGYLLFSLFPRVLDKGLHGKFDGRVADEHVHPSVMPYGLLYERLGLCSVRNVGLEYEALSPKRPYLGEYLPGLVARAQAQLSVELVLAGHVERMEPCLQVRQVLGYERGSNTATCSEPYGAGALGEGVVDVDRSPVLEDRELCAETEVIHVVVMHRRPIPCRVNGLDVLVRPRGSAAAVGPARLL